MFNILYSLWHFSLDWFRYYKFILVIGESLFSRLSHLILLILFFLLFFRIIKVKIRELLSSQELLLLIPDFSKIDKLEFIIIFICIEFKLLWSIFRFFDSLYCLKGFFKRKAFFAAILDYPFFILIIHYNEDFLIAKLREFNSFLEEAPLSLAEGHAPLATTFYFLALVNLSLSHLI